MSDDLPDRLRTWAELDKIEARAVLNADLIEAADRIQELEDDSLIVSLMSDSSDEVFATLELTKEEHSQILRVGIMELIKMGMGE